jgi:hypothetical protein
MRMTDFSAPAEGGKLVQWVRARFGWSAPAPSRNSRRRRNASSFQEYPQTGFCLVVDCQPDEKWQICEARYETRYQPWRSK